MTSEAGVSEFDVRERLSIEVTNEGGRMSRRLRVTPSGIVFIVVFVAVIVLIGFPIAGILLQSLRGEGGLSFASYVEFFQTPRLVAALRATLLVAVGTAVGSVVVATILAFGVARTGMRAKGLVRFAVIVSFASPPFLMTLAYILLAGPNNGLANQAIRLFFNLDLNRGPLNIYSLWGFLLLALPNTIAYVFVIMLPGFANMDPALEEASRVGGSGPIGTIFRISLPVMKPGLLAGALLSFSTALAMFATPYILRIDVLTVSMRRSIITDGNYTVAATIAAVSAAVSLVVMFLYRRSLRASLRYQTITGKGFRAGKLDVGWVRHCFTGMGIVYAAVAALIPYTLLVLISFLSNPYKGVSVSNLTLDHYRFILNYDLVRSAFKNSLILGISAATIIAILGMLVGYVVSRTKVPGRAVVDYIAVLPLGIAGTAFAVGVIIVNLQTPVVLLALYGTLWILLAAYVGRYLPWGVRASQVSLFQVGRELEEASRVGGASELRTIWHIVAPLIRPGIAYAWILGMVQAFTEVSASALLVSPGQEVVATALLRLWTGANGLSRACALGVLMFIITMVLVLIAQRVGGQSIVADPDAAGGFARRRLSRTDAKVEAGIN